MSIVGRLARVAGLAGRPPVPARPGQPGLPARAGLRAAPFPAPLVAPRVRRAQTPVRKEFESLGGIGSVLLVESQRGRA
jgi:hypothetical protein